MTDLVFRTEDLRPEEVLNLFAESASDRRIVDALKSRNPVVLVGSRGVGKSFLLRVAEAELLQSLSSDRVLPVYVSFTKSSLVRAHDAQRFQHWMLAKLSARVLRVLGNEGVSGPLPRLVERLVGGSTITNTTLPIEDLVNRFENSWQNPDLTIDSALLPSVDSFKEAIDDLCHTLSIKRLVVLFDEAAHIFLPEQQRAFFTLFRDLRSPVFSCKAAIYPGVTAFGDTFQPAHDATLLTVDRDVLDPTYVEQMREIVSKQADAALQVEILKNRDLFAALAFAATGNPRLLLKTLARVGRITRDSVNGILKTFYRTELWAEHSSLGTKYEGHRALIDWGRAFVEDEVFPALRARSAQRLEEGRGSTAFFWIHKDAPEPVNEALRLLAYTGIVTEHSQAIKATRSEIGTRYLANLGVFFSGFEPNPATQAYELATALDPRRMIEFGANYQSFMQLRINIDELPEGVDDAALEAQLAKPVEVLDITEWQKTQLRNLRLTSIRDVLNATEWDLRRAPYVGQKRSRRIRNAAIAAVLEYLSG